jgi:L,D-peptidoglycan transpeptidase YkuD (ErfK/YbiS/YcfS/YnhG family)
MRIIEGHRVFGGLQYSNQFIMQNLTRLNSIKILIIILISSFSLMLNSCRKPPYEKQESAKNVLVKATTGEAHIYAATAYAAAESTFQQAQLEMAYQKGRLFLLCDYDNCDSLFDLTIARANNAMEQAAANRTNIINTARQRYEQFSKEITDWRSALDGSLFLYQAEKQWSAANMALGISKKLINQGLYQEALAKLDSGNAALTGLSREMEEYTNSYAEKIQTWNKWIAQTVDKSKRDQKVAIIVVKATHKFYVLKSGSIINTFNCELGQNSAYQKFFAGDGATPEGVYKITTINHRSKYYKAMMLDYPNENDKRRFAQNKANGIISANARIGALIEIHGEGGKNKDWTNGCVALPNKDIDRLLKYVKVGTPVTIIRFAESWP